MQLLGFAARACSDGYGMTVVHYDMSVNRSYSDRSICGDSMCGDSMSPPEHMHTVFCESRTYSPLASPPDAHLFQFPDHDDHLTSVGPRNHRLKCYLKSVLDLLPLSQTCSPCSARLRRMRRWWSRKLSSRMAVLPEWASAGKSLTFKSLLLFALQVWQLLELHEQEKRNRKEEFSGTTGSTHESVVVLDWQKSCN